MVRKARVEIVYQEERFTGFDFGDFAFIACRKNNGKDMYVYKDEKYSEFYVLAQWHDLTLCGFTEEFISEEDFLEIKSIVRNLKKSLHPRLKQLLDKNFKEYLDLVTKN